MNRFWSLIKNAFSSQALERCSPDERETDSFEISVVENEFIIRLNEYLPIPEIQAKLTAALGPGGWTWVPRPAPARAFPSDFAVIATEGGEADRAPTAASLLLRLRAPGSPLRHRVRDVHAQRMVQRRLASLRPHEEGGVGVGKGGAGRFQTRPTIGLGKWQATE